MAPTKRVSVFIQILNIMLYPAVFLRVFRDFVVFSYDLRNINKQ